VQEIVGADGDVESEVRVINVNTAKSELNESIMDFADLYSSLSEKSIIDIGSPRSNDG
jgi:hypothetical protein